MRPSIPSAVSAPRAGFTLLEIVFVIGMVALLAGIVSSFNLQTMLESNGAKPAFEVFREATHEGRIQAINRAEVIYLTFDEEAQVFRLTSAKDVVPEEENDSSLPEFNRHGYLVDEPEEETLVEEDEEAAGRREFPVFEDELIVEMRGIRAAEAGGLRSTNFSYTDEPLPNLVFHPSGVSSPAVVIMKYSNGEELTLTLDSFSNGPQLSVDEGVGF